MSGHKHNAPYGLAYRCGREKYTPALTNDEAKDAAAKMAYSLVYNTRIYSSTRQRYFRELVVAYLASVADARGTIEGLFEGRDHSPFDEPTNGVDTHRLPEHGNYYIFTTDSGIRVYLLQPYKSGLGDWTISVAQGSIYKDVSNARNGIRRMQEAASF